MTTAHHEQTLQFQSRGRREVVAECNGELITLDAGVLLQANVSCVARSVLSDAVGRTVSHGER